MGPNQVREAIIRRRWSETPWSLWEGVIQRNVIPTFGASIWVRRESPPLQSRVDFFADTLIWKKAIPQTPIYKRLSHSASQVGSYLFIVGGHNGADYCSEILFLNLGSSFPFLWNAFLTTCSIASVRSPDGVRERSKQSRKPCHNSRGQSNLLVRGIQWRARLR